MNVESLAYLQVKKRDFVWHILRVGNIYFLDKQLDYNRHQPIFYYKHKLHPYTYVFLDNLDKQRNGTVHALERCNYLGTLHYIT